MEAYYRVQRKETYVEKKQKMLIALLAVAGIGAGSFFYFTREGANEAPAVVEGSSARKERKASDKPAATTERKEKTVKTAAAPPPTTRKERTERTEEAAGRKSRTKGPTEITKKKKLAPAAWRLTCF